MQKDKGKKALDIIEFGMIFFSVLNETDANELWDKGLICNIIKMYKNVLFLQQVVTFSRNVLINELYNWMIINFYDVYR